MDGLTKKETPDRSKINMHQPHEVHYWTKHLNVSKEELQKAIDKVGNSAAAVRKQLGISRAPFRWSRPTIGPAGSGRRIERKGPP